MPKPPFKRVEELFHQAAALDHAERDSFLDTACAGDRELRAAVADLLKHHTAGKETEDFLISPIARAALSPEATQVGSGAVAEPVGAAPLPRIPGYAILEELGRGGMGVVYKARQLALNRVVALKMLLPQAQITAEHLARFRSEAEALARLHHPNIVPIYDFGECAGAPFFTMAYVPGPSLAKVLDGRAQEISQAARLAEVLARAVHAMHQCGIIHRDLKPGNILLAPPADGSNGGQGSTLANETGPARLAVPVLASGVPMITDFGLATDPATTHRLTVTGATMGTPAYMAPEQVQGRAGAVGPAVDVYALGSILYEMLTGRPPFDADTPAETMAQLLRDEPVSPARLRPRLPRDLVTICLKCLEKAPGKRFASALELAEDLERFLAGQPILCRPVGPVARVHRWSRRQPLAAGLLLLCAALATAFVVTVMVYNARLQEALAEVKALAEQQRQQIIQLNIHIGTDELEQGDSFTAVLRFAEALRLDEADAARAPEHRARIAKALKKSPRLVGMTAQDKQVVCAHPDGPGSMLTTASVDGRGVAVWDLATGQQVGAVLPLGTIPIGCAFSPDGRLLATVGTDGEVAIWDPCAESGRRVLVAGAQLGRRLAVDGRVAFLAGGRTLLGGDNESGLILWDLTTKPPTAVLKLPHCTLHELALSADRRRLFTPAAGGTGQVWDAANGKAVGPPLRLEHAISRAALSRDGGKLAIVDTAGMLRTWDLAGARVVAGPVAVGAAVSQVVFSPEDDRVLTAGGAGGARIWRAATGELVCVVPQQHGAVHHACFSPNGQLVAIDGRETGAQVWDATAGRAVTPPLRQGAPLATLGFAEGGKHFITVGQRGTVCVWELPGEEENQSWIAELATDSRPVGELVEVAQVLACRHVDEQQAHVRLDAKRLHAAWQSLGLGQK